MHAQVAVEGVEAASDPGEPAAAFANGHVETLWMLVQVLVEADELVPCGCADGHAQEAWIGRQLPGPAAFAVASTLADQVERAIRPPMRLQLKTSAICIENTHNAAGGKVMSLALTHSIADVAQSRFPWTPARRLVRDRFERMTYSEAIRVLESMGMVGSRRRVGITIRPLASS